MARLQQLLRRVPWKCSTCRVHVTLARSQLSLLKPSRRLFTTAKRHEAEAEVRAAPEITFDDLPPARVVPASPSYFTASPVFNDNILLLQSLLRRHSSLPTIPPDQVPRNVWMKLSQYRSTIGETIAASKYSRVLLLLNRLNRIHPKLRPAGLNKILNTYIRPGSAEIQKAKPGTIDEFGRSRAVGRRKEASATVQLVEGDGQVLVNGRKLLEVFPRAHDRESALWALKVTERMDKYNVFALVHGGGTTGQAESVTLALAKALLVHEPALKPVLRRGKLIHPYSVYSW
jgi:small subunit ribosomal protein S9